MTKADYLRNTIDLVKQIETRYLELGRRLYRIRTQELWKGEYENYQEFLDTARINISDASKSFSIHKSYIVEGGMTMAQLRGIGYSNLYEAIPLIERDGVETAVTKAETLTRDEIKDEVRDERHGAHRHKVGTERWGACEKCGKMVHVDI